MFSNHQLLSAGTGLLCLLAFSGTVAADTSSTDADMALSASQINDRLLQATKSINARDYAQACSELRLLPQELYEPQPQLTYNTWFLLGQCHAGLGLYDEARGYFQKVVEADPDAPRPRLDLALIEQYQGNFGAANEQFDYLLDEAELSEDIEEKVDALYSQRPDRLRYFIEGEFGTVSDSNINYGPDGESMRIYDKEFVFNREARPISSTGVHTGLNLTVEKLLNKKSRIGGRLSIDGTTYSDNEDFNHQILDLHVAYRRKLWEGEYMIQPRYASVTLGEETLFTVMGLEGGYAWLQSSDLRLTGLFSYKNYTYSTDDRRNTGEFKPQLLASYRHSDQVILNGRFAYAIGNASEQSYGYSDLELGAGVSYAFSPALMASLDYEMSSTSYAGELEGFDATRQDDRTKISAEVTYNLQQLGDFFKRFNLDLGVRNYTNSSNIALYQNSRTQSYLTVRCTF